MGLLTHYMPAHYSAGWWMDSAATLAEAEAATFVLFAGLKKVTLHPQRAAAGRHRLHPAEQVGHRDSPGLERALHLAQVRLRAAEGVLRRGAWRARRAWGRTDAKNSRGKHTKLGQVKRSFQSR